MKMRFHDLKLLPVQAWTVNEGLLEPSIHEDEPEFPGFSVSGKDPLASNPDLDTVEESLEIQKELSELNIDEVWMKKRLEEVDVGSFFFREDELDLEVEEDAYENSFLGQEF